MDKLRIEDRGFVALFIVLFALPFLNLATNSLGFLFNVLPDGSSWFAIISGISILFYFIIWGFVRLRSQFRGKRLPQKIVWRIMSQKASNVIGLRKPSLKGSVYIFVSIVIGMIGNFLILVVLSTVGYGTLYRVPSPIGDLWQSLIVAPIFEEFIYRGIYLGVFLKFFGKSRKYAAVALIMSSFIFGWIHPALPIVKTIGGFLIGSIYLFGWRKNLVASSLAHFGANLTGSFLVLG